VILLTGAAGFIGYRIAKRLQADGVGFVSVDNLDAFGSRPEHQDVRHIETYAPKAVEGAEFYRKRQGTPQAITGIVHMGACSDTTELRIDYLNEVNLNYTKSLWTRAQELGVPFVYASSAATYGAGELGYDDDEALMAKLKPLNPYGQSKLDFDVWALEQDRLGRCPPGWSGFKFFNVYGFGERHKGKMASVVLQGFDQILSKGELKLFKSHKAGIADGEQKRDFIYVEDVVDVVLLALKRPFRRGVYNLGTGEARSFFDLAKATFQALGKPPQIQFIDTPVEIRDRYQYFTQAKMQKTLQAMQAAGARPSFTSLEAGVALTIRDLQSFESQKKA
jgi:ADP-L-glycero-D-manno-heptose 6-epimerase